MTKQIKIIITAIVLFFVLAIGSVAIWRILGNDSAWICSDGQWVKYGSPVGSAPESPCGEENSVGEMTDWVKVAQPSAEAEVSSPFVVTGEARGMWFFEASFPVELLDENGNLLTIGIATAQGDWMTENFVPFTVELNYVSDKDQSGILVLKRDNPSGLSEFDANIKIPVFLKKSEATTFSVFFGNALENPDALDCALVYQANRATPQTVAVARSALEALLLGPTEEEKSQGFYTSIPDRVQIQSLTIENGIAKVDLSEELDKNIGGLCRVLAIRSQIENTLKQFPSISEVVLSINGHSEDILQP